MSEDIMTQTNSDSLHVLYALTVKLYDVSNPFIQSKSKESRVAILQRYIWQYFCEERGQME